MSILAKWLTVRLRTKWLWVQISLQPLKLQMSRLFRARSSLTFTQLQSVDSLEKCVCDMIRTQSVLVILAIFLSTFTGIHFMSTFFARGTSLVATEFHAPLTTWSGLRPNYLVD